MGQYESGIWERKNSYVYLDGFRTVISVDVSSRGHFLRIRNCSRL